MSDALPPALHAAVARDEIRQVLARYCRGIDRMDPDLVASCYHPGARDDHGPTFKGPAEEFATMVMDVLARFERTLHFLGTSIIDVDGDVAHSETYCIAYHRSRAEDGPQADRTAAVRYVDRFERRNGEWRIADRVVVLEWTRTDPVGAAPPPSPDFEAARRSRDDIVYHPR